jgi:hypothetical protein
MGWDALEAELAEEFVELQVQHGYLSELTVSRRARAPLRAIHCKVCRAWFTPLDSHRRYCSASCFSRRGRLPRRRAIHCARCGVWFTPLHGRRIHCSAECSRLARVEGARGWRASHREQHRAYARAYARAHLAERRKAARALAIRRKGDNGS